MSDYDNWLANSAPGVNDKEWDDTCEIECPCGFQGDAEGLMVGDNWIATFYWSCPWCNREDEMEVEL